MNLFSAARSVAAAFLLGALGMGFPPTSVPKSVPEQRDRYTWLEDILTYRAMKFMN